MNTEDASRFEELVRSPIRSEERESAIKQWHTYKAGKQMAFVQRGNAGEGGANNGKVGLWSKGDYVRALTVPAIDLCDATFEDVCLGYVDMRGAKMDRVRFTQNYLTWSAMKGAQLECASLCDADLPHIRLLDANLMGVNLSGANLQGADFSRANLAGVNLKGADLRGAILEYANMVGANVEGAKLDGAHVYGVSAWDLRGQPASSTDLIVTPQHTPSITTDNIRVAQFIYLLVNNPEIRDVLDTVTRKVVLLLGRFKPERKAVLDALKVELRSRNLVPVIFDFDQAEARDITETITLLARISRFVIADLTEPSSIPQELQAIAPDVAVPIRLIIQEPHAPYAMAKDLKKYPWVIKPFKYTDINHLLAQLDADIIHVANAVAESINQMRAEDVDW